MFHQDGQRRVGIEWRAPGQHLVEHDAQRVDVAAGIAFPFQPLLRRHVVQRAHQRAGDGVARAADDLGDAKVADDGLPAPGQHDVGWLDVAVDDAFAVGIGQSV